MHGAGGRGGVGGGGGLGRGGGVGGVLALLVTMTSENLSTAWNPQYVYGFMRDKTDSRTKE